MSETTNIRDFCKQPMGTKPVSDIPGVGPVAANKLRSMDLTKAMDLYNKLKSLNFDHKKFRDWITLNCKEAKVATVYKALWGWHSQFGKRRNDADLGRARAGNPRVKPLGRAVPVTIASPRESERDNNSPDNIDEKLDKDDPRSNNILSLFFASFAESCNKISPEFHSEFKMAIKRAISSVVSEFERKSRKRQSEDAPSTSRATSGVDSKPATLQNKKTKIMTRHLIHEVKREITEHLEEI